MIADLELDRLIIAAYSAMPIPVLAPRRRAAKPVARLALAVALLTVTVLLVVFASTLVERRTVPAEAPSPTPTPRSLTPQEILLNARQTIAAATDYKYRIYHTGPATSRTPVIARRGTEWELSVSVHCAPQRHHSVLRSTSDRFYQESVYFSPTEIWLRSGPDDPWQHLVIKGGAICGDETAPLLLASGGWDQLYAQARNDADLPCGTKTCFAVVADKIDFYAGSVIAGSVSERVLVEQDSFRPVQVRYFIEWLDGRSALEVQDFYDYGVPNAIDPPQ